MKNRLLRLPGLPFSRDERIAPSVNPFNVANSGKRKKAEAAKKEDANQAVLDRMDRPVRGAGVNKYKLHLLFSPHLVVFCLWMRGHLPVLLNTTPRMLELIMTF
jgi:hypothetical protein